MPVFDKLLKAFPSDLFSSGENNNNTSVRIVIQAPNWRPSFGSAEMKCGMGCTVIRYVKCNESLFSRKIVVYASPGIC